MANKTINQLTELTTPASDDEFVISDTNDSTEAKKITFANNEAALDHANIQNIGTNTHAQIDTHIGSTANPHSVDIDDVTPTTTKGDIIVEGGSNAIRVAVGTNDQVLTADSAQASGVKWADAAGGLLSTTKYAPQGFLINGKIVPSVASNNLTVAIKGMDGNDPSGSNIVYCRIGDTVRQITSALSVTTNAGTNWFDSGSSELATQEVDYFVYLGYNATDGVTIGFAKIPWANEYGDFSTTSTNEKYAAISDITTAASGDDYELIGRFAATLSAGAGYTWTVPTFDTTNLIQRPVCETRWLTWSPVYGASGSMTYTSVTENLAAYKVGMNKLNIALETDGTTGGTTNTVVSATMPFANPESIFQSAGCGVGDTAVVAGNAAYLATSKTVNFVKYDRSNWTLTASAKLAINAFWKI